MCLEHDNVGVERMWSVQATGPAIQNHWRTQWVKGSKPPSHWIFRFF